MSDFRQTLEGLFKSLGKETVRRLMRLGLSRRTYARLARFLWLDSRLDVGNDMSKNGERTLQAEVLRNSAGHSVRVFDVGANDGRWSSQLLSLLGDVEPPLTELDLHLFEPDPTAFDELTSTVASSQRHGVECHFNQMAVTDENGPQSFEIVSPGAGQNSLKAFEAIDVSESVTVAGTTLDSYCAEDGIEHIDLLKIDTEGNDFNVLKGASSLLEQGAVDFVQFEYNFRWIEFRQFLRDVFEFVEPFDYNLGKLTERGIEVYPKWHRELESFREGNYLLFQSLSDLEIPQVDWWVQT